MDERDEPGPATAPADDETDGAVDAEQAAARELEAYRREKQDTGRRMAQRARVSRDPEPGADRPGSGGVADDGNAERP